MLRTRCRKLWRAPRYPLSSLPCSSPFQSPYSSSANLAENEQGTSPVYNIPLVEEENTAAYTHDALRLKGLTGGQIFLQMMKRHNVEQVFGYPGGAILPVYDAIYGTQQFKFVLTRHEQGSGHMAQGYARRTGRTGVCLVTSGPGATNMVTPLQDALSDGTPLVAFSGQVPTAVLGTGAFQEADVVGITRACTKWSTMVRDIADLPRTIDKAFRIAHEGRPGPVLVDLPKDITSRELTEDIRLEPLPTPPNRKVVEQPSPQTMYSIERAAHMINNAKKPVIFAGQGVLISEAERELLELATKAQIPVTTSLLGLGGFDELNPLSLHMLGMHGSAYANYAIQQADVVIGIGVRFDDRVTGNLEFFLPEAKKAEKEGRGGILQFDISEENINKVVKVTKGIVGDCKQNLDLLLPLINPIKPEQRSSFFKDIEGWKKDFRFDYQKSKDDTQLMKPQTVLEELDKQCRDMKEEVLVTTGVGQHQMWAAQYFRWRHPRTFFSSGGLGTMGFGLPCALGVKVASPDKIVVDIDGDASFSMTAMELATAAEFGIGVKVLLLNNNFQGMVKQWQDLFYDKRYSGTKMTNPDFVALAEAMNVKGIRLNKPSELPEKMKEFLNHPGPVLMDAQVCPDEHVYPMVPSGKALDDMVLFQDKTAPDPSSFKGQLPPG